MMPSADTVEILFLHLGILVAAFLAVNPESFLGALAHKKVALSRGLVIFFRLGAVLIAYACGEILGSRFR